MKRIIGLISILLLSMGLARAIPTGNGNEFIPAPHNLGIGFFNPVQKLAVNGAALFAEKGTNPLPVITGPGGVIYVNGSHLFFKSSVRTGIGFQLDATNTINNSYVNGNNILDGTLTINNKNGSILNGAIKNSKFENPTLNGNILFGRTASVSGFLNGTLNGSNLIVQNIINGSTLIGDVVKVNRNLTAPYIVTPFINGGFKGNGNELTKLNGANIIANTIPASSIASVDNGSLSGFTANGLVFANRTGKLTNNPDKIFIDPVTSNIGIGTTSPMEKIEVVGTILATAFNGDGAALKNLNPAAITAGTLPISVRSAADPWILVHSENFQGTPVGWSNNTTTSCAGHKILGGFGVASTTVLTKNFDLTAYPHTHVKVNFNYYSIDSWDNETGLAKIDGMTAWSTNELFYSNQERTILANCGSGGFSTNTTLGKDLILTGEARLDHSSNTLRVDFASTLNEATDNESYGIDNLEIWVKNSAPEPTLPLGPGPSDNLSCGAGGQYTLLATEFNNLVGSRGSFDRGNNQVSIDWRKCDNQVVSNNTSNGGARISFINPPRPGTVTFTINRPSVSAYGGLQLAWAPNITWVGPRGTPTSANATALFVFRCDFNGSSYVCTWL